MSQVSKRNCNKLKFCPCDMASDLNLNITCWKSQGEEFIFHCSCVKNSQKKETPFWVLSESFLSSPPPITVCQRWSYSAKDYKTPRKIFFFLWNLPFGQVSGIFKQTTIPSFFFFSLLCTKLKKYKHENISDTLSGLSYMDLLPPVW